MTENQLITLAKTKNEEAINKIIKEYEINIKRIIKKYYYSFNNLGLDKNDIYQELLLTLFKTIKSYSINKEVSFKTYLNKNLENSILDIIRTYNRGKHKVLNESISIDQDNLHNLFSTKELPEDKITLLEIDSEIKKILTNEELKVYELKKESKTVKEISYILDKPIKSIYNTTRRIKIKLQNID